MLGTGKFSRPVINVLMTTYTLLTGMHIDQMVTFFRHINCGSPGRTTMHNLNNLVNKVVYDYWLRMQAKFISECKNQDQPLHLGGDGAYDSPGFNARNCNYLIMDLGTKRILSFFTAIKFQVAGGSAAMEPFAAKTCLLSLINNFGVKIASFTTDRSSSIASMMREDPILKNIDHQYDIWHWIKSVMKDIFNYCKAKCCSNLALWKDSISNMLWHSFATSASEQELKEKILSILHHCCDNHEFPNNEIFKECGHGDLRGTERNKPWLREDTGEVQKLRSALLGKDKRRFEDLAKMTGFHHTGDIENVNSLSNKYRPKAYVYTYEGMIARQALAIIDHNTNIGRKQAVKKDGTPKIRTECDRAGKKWRTRDVLEPKDYSFRDEIAREIMIHVEMKTVPDVVLPTGQDLPKNQSKIEQPSKDSLLKTYQTRLKHRIG